MNVLIITPEYPYPSNGGNKIALHGYICALKEIGYNSFDLITFDTNITEGNNFFGSILLLPKPKKINFFKILKSFFLKKSYLFLRYFSKSNYIAIENFLKNQRYDLCLIQHSYMAELVNLKDLALVNTLTILSSEVLECRALKEKSHLTKSFIKKKIFDFESKNIKKAELRILGSSYASLFYGQEDYNYYVYKSKFLNGHLVSLGLDLEKYKQAIPSNNPIKKIAFYGSFSWFPNCDGLDFLLNEIWPIVSEQRADILLQIVGRHIPNWAYSIAKNSTKIELIGEVQSMYDFLSTVSIVLAPIRIGGGIRLKILEAMAYGVPIISTTIGLEGNTAELDSAVRVANTTYEFLKEINLILDNENIRKKCIKNSLRYINQHHNAKSKLAQQLSHIIGTKNCY